MRRVLFAFCAFAGYGCGASIDSGSNIQGLEDRLDQHLVSSPGELQFLTLAATNNRSHPSWGTVLKDVVNHEAPGDSNSYDDLVTLAHETSHGIHSYIRNKMNNSGRRANGFYVMQNRAVIVPEPNMRKSHIAPYVPASLRGTRYSMYITGQTAWDDTPLYVWDEWNAYVNGGEAGVNQVESGLWNAGWRDGVAGQLEFVVYAFATAMAVRDRDPVYYRDMSQFHDFLTWNAQRTMEVYRKGAVMPDFKWDWQDQYWTKIKTSPDAEAFRSFVRTQYGAQWTMDVMGF